MATATYQFNAWNAANPGAWDTNGGNIVDGNDSSFGRTNDNGDYAELTANQCTGTDLGTITKVEVHCSWASNGSGCVPSLVPVFSGTTDGDSHAVTTSSSAQTDSAYFDITSDTNAPGTWGWSDIQNMDLRIDVARTANRIDIYYVDIRVTYSTNAAPTVALDTPADTGTVSSTTPELDFTGTDPDGDDISYEIQVATDNTFAPGQAAPTLIGTSGNTWTDTSGTTRATGSLSWQTGDLIVVVGMHENNNHSIGTPTASGLTFSSVSGFPTNTGSSCKAYAWQATAGSNGSGAISATLDQSGDMGNIQAFVYRGSDGIGNTYAVATGTSTTNNLTRGSDKSAVVWAGGDWGATNDTTVSSVPSGGTERQAAYVSGAATMFCFDWDDQGDAGTTSYGISGLSTGSNFTKIALEIQGSTSASSIIIDKLSDTDTGFVNKDNGGDTDPFTSGDQIGYTVQAGDALTDTNTYYWRVRGEDPSGTGTFGAWSSTYSFTVDTSAGGGDGSFFYLFSDML